MIREISEKEIRLESIKAASRVASPYEGVGNLLTHADWLTSFILTGNRPEVETVGS